VYSQICEKREAQYSVSFFTASLPGGHSEREPPDSISNSEVKPLSADDSVGFPHVKVGHCQAFYSALRINMRRDFYALWISFRLRYQVVGNLTDSLSRVRLFVGLFEFCPGIPQRDCAIKHHMIDVRVLRIHTEIALALKLIMASQ
jgi:hypothetical protein